MPLPNNQPPIAITLPPLHPALVHFPIALIVLSAVAEFIGYFRPSIAARSVAWWALVGALIGGVLAIWSGYSDMERANLSHETHELVHQHLRIGLFLGVCMLLLTGWRWRLRSKAFENSQQDTNRPVGKGYLGAAVLVVLLTVFQGNGLRARRWRGGSRPGHGATRGGEGALGRRARLAQQDPSPQGFP